MGSESRTEGTKKRIGKLEDRTIELTQWGNKVKIDQKRNLNRDLGIYKTIYISPEEKEKIGRTEKSIKEIMVVNYPNLTRDINLQIQEAEQIPNKLIKLLKIKNKEEKS